MSKNSKGGKSQGETKPQSSNTKSNYSGKSKTTSNQNYPDAFRNSPGYTHSYEDI